MSRFHKSSFEEPIPGSGIRGWEDFFTAVSAQPKGRAAGPVEPFPRALCLAIDVAASLALYAAAYLLLTVFR